MAPAGAARREPPAGGAGWHQWPLGAEDPGLSGGGWGRGPAVADAPGAVVAGLYDGLGGVAGVG